MSNNLVKVGMTPNIKSLKEISKRKYKEGFTYNKYVEFLENRINIENNFSLENPNINKIYRYKDLNIDQIEYLKNNFKNIEQYFNNKNAKKYEDIKFRRKQKKNYNKKKNELIEEYREKRLTELDILSKSKLKDDICYIKWVYHYNMIYQYNCVVPGAHSRESLRKIVLKL